VATSRGDAGPLALPEPQGAAARRAHPGIDVGAKAEVQGVIDELAADGLAVVLISSDLEELIEGSDRVVVLKDGSQVGELTGADVTEPALLAALAAAPPPAPGPPPAESPPAPKGGA